MKKVDRLQNAISARQVELNRVADILVRSAYDLRRKGTILRILLIVFGALTAAQGTFRQMQSIPSGVSDIIFLILGVLIATLAGIEAAFRLESRGAELNTLAATCHSIARQADSMWHRKLGLENNVDTQIQGALELLDLQDSKLQEVQEKAAHAGVNITLLVRRRLRKIMQDDGTDDSEGIFVDESNADYKINSLIDYYP